MKRKEVLTDAKSFHPLLELAGILSVLNMPWYIAGGWAIDLYLHKCRRKHKDIDIAVFREDQLIIQRYFLDQGWRLWKYVGDTEALEPWLPDEKLELPNRGVFVERPHAEIVHIDILLSEKHGKQWWYHRDGRITYPIKTLGMRSDLGIPYLSPEIVLLFKARHLSIDEPNYILHRQADENDFQAIHKLLSAKRRAWLRKAIEILYPNHVWLQYLRQLGQNGQAIGLIL
jgi:hypothetical protein